VAVLRACGATLNVMTLGGLAMSLVTLVTWWATNAFLPFVVRHLSGPGASPAAVAGNVTYASLFFNLGGFLGTLATVPLASLGRRPLFAIYFAGAAAAIWRMLKIASGVSIIAHTRVL